MKIVNLFGNPRADSDLKFNEFSNIPLEHTTNPRTTVYEVTLFIWGVEDAWSMLQGYLGVLLEKLNGISLKSSISTSLPNSIKRVLAEQIQNLQLDAKRSMQSVLTFQVV